MPSAEHDKIITGAARIARRLGCCERTVRRTVDAGRLHAFKVGGRTSPLKITDSKLRAYMRESDAN